MALIETIAKEIQPTVKVADESFGVKDTQLCSLSIEIDELRFRFCAVQEDNRQCRWLEDYASDTFLNQGELLEKLKQISAEHAFLNSDSWKSISVTVNTNAFTLVPAPLFRKEYAAEYLHLVLGKNVQPEDRVMHHYLAQIDAYNVFTIPSDWAEWLMGLYPFQTIEFCHLTSPLITGALASHKEYNEPRILSACFEEEYVTLLFTESGKLIFCNRFRYNNAQELTYLILFTLNQINYQPENVKMYLYGEITPYADTFTELARFIPHLHFGQNPGALDYTANFEDIPGHRYFGLLNTCLMPR
ncbi:DUF3822 family protein [Telluribacter humicola]|uniref:DUF3822 family protein n=1 Tax=Telluribacter humicola TaxID=1720261 RepID=UPI001A96B9B1|nr:DUF3822 family protein [Telluribacter humicola]